MRGTFDGNLWGGVHGGTNDQIMSREGGLYKCIFQYSEHCKS